MNNYSIFLINSVFYVLALYIFCSLRTLPSIEVISHDYHNSKRVYRALTLNQEWFTNMLGKS